jgi:ubiquinone/menaquinone biosynthesis C-methylase UbiE
MPYQTFPNEQGNSNSSGKLLSIKMPKSLSGMSLLDIGCNEGFFCAEAIRRGASRVVGIDNSQDAINKARNRTPEAEFFCGSWDSLPEGVFDVVLLMSAFHYAEQPLRLLSNICKAMSPTGLLILECGVASGNTASWISVTRAIDVRRFPTFKMLTDVLLSGFASRRMGRSVMQNGDPVQRFVFHCRPFKPEVVVVRGNSGVGKTVLCREFSKGGGHVISADAWCVNRGIPSLSIGPHLNSMSESELVNLGRDIAKTLTLEPRITFVEGYLFSLPPAATAFTEYVLSQGGKVWMCDLQ